MRVLRGVVGYYPNNALKHDRNLLKEEIFSVPQFFKTQSRIAPLGSEIIW